MEISKIFDAISLLIAVVCLSFLIVQIRQVFMRNSDANVKSLFFPIVILVTSMTYFSFKKRVQEEEKSFPKLHYESKSDYFYNDKGERYYKLKLDNGNIIRDSLQEGWDYFYNDKGERYYKSNIIYSKKLNK